MKRKFSNREKFLGLILLSLIFICTIQLIDTNKENEEHNDSAGEDFDHNFDFTVSLDDEYINNIEKKEK